MNLQIATKLQQLRKENGYTQEELADILGISRQAVSKWERAESSPDTDNLISLAKLYKVSLDEILQINDTDKQIDNKNTDKLVEALDSTSVVVITLSYLIFSAIFDIWHPLWIIFLFIPINSTLIHAIYKKNANYFAYPILVLAIYLLFSFIYNIWHPLWIIFITVPFYYTIVGLFNDDEE